MRPMAWVLKKIPARFVALRAYRSYWAYWAYMFSGSHLRARDI